MTWPIQPLWRKLLTRRRNNALTSSSSSSSSIIELRERFVLDFCFVQMCIIIVILAIIAVRKLLSFAFCILCALIVTVFPKNLFPRFSRRKKQIQRELHATKSTVREEIRIVLGIK